MHRPVSPARGAGRLQKAAKRELLLGNGITSTGAVARRAYGRRKLEGKPIKPVHYVCYGRSPSQSAGLADVEGRRKGA